jgi:hypothetical protein
MCPPAGPNMFGPGPRTMFRGLASVRLGLDA